MKQQVIIVLVMCAVISSTISATTIYVDASNTGAQDGLTPTTAWTNLDSAFTDLATANSSAGGHTILVAPGTYSQTAQAVTSIHSGGATPNRLAGSGSSAKLATLVIPLTLSGCTNFVVQNLTVSNKTLTVSASSPYNVISNCIVRAAVTGISVASSDTLITHCVIFDNTGDGIYNVNSITRNLVNHCTISHNGKSGIANGNIRLSVRNSILFGNGVFGLHAAHTSSSYNATTNLFYGNGGANYYWRQVEGYYNTAEEINSAPSCAGNIVDTPGFVTLTNWDFGTLYADSPCLNAADDGTPIGAYPTPSLVAVSTKTYYVATDGDDSRLPAAAENSATPWASVSNAAHYAIAGDTVMVGVGTYAGRVSITRGGSQNPVTYRTVAGAKVVNTGDSGFYLDRVANVTVDGFEITGCSIGLFSSYAVGCTITNGSVHNNSPDGLSFALSRCMVVENMSIFSNTTYGIHDASYTGGSKISGCRIWQNGTGIYPYKYMTLTRSMIYDNTNHGIEIPNFGGVSIDHCAFYGNMKSGVRAGYLVTPVIRNSVIAGNGDNGLEESHTAAAFNATTNVFFANGGANYSRAEYDLGNIEYLYNTAEEINSAPLCAGNLVTNPGFVSLTNWDFGTLYADSPCLNAGDDGTAIGAYTNPSLVTISSKTYYVATGGDDTRLPATAEISTTPWASISNAAHYAIAGDTVMVGAGTYTGRVSITRGGSQNPVTYRTVAGAKVVNAGDSGFYLDRVSNVVIDGFDITGCLNGLYYSYALGCRILNGSTHNNGANGICLDHTQDTAIENMLIYSNSTYGVYLYNRSGGETVVDRCRIFAHTGSSDCGIYAESYSLLPRRISNSDIFDNFYGVSATYVITRLENCVIYGNTFAGVSLNVGSVGYLVNCIVAGNTYGVYEMNTGPEFSCSNCCFYANTTAHYYDHESGNLTTVAQINALTDVSCANNIEGDPGFRDPAAGDFRITEESPCWNAGTPATDLVLDLYGGERLVGLTVDIGSYEVPLPQGTIIIIQ